MPRNLYAVVQRCPAGRPRVVANHPWPQAPGDARFFPTLFWLTCPREVADVGRLEGRGALRDWQAELDHDPRARRSLRAAHQDYQRLRSQLGATRVSGPRTRSSSPGRSGIGGTANFNTIKCLHMHYAHHLAGGRNPVGLKVARQLVKQEPPTACRHCGQAQPPAGVAE